MKQIRTIFTAVCLCIFLSMPMTVFAAPEPEPATWTENMEGRPADAGEDVESAVDEKGAKAEQETGTAPETEERKEIKQEAEAEQAETKPQAAVKNSGTLRIQNAAAGTGESFRARCLQSMKGMAQKRGNLRYRKEPLPFPFLWGIII